MGRSQSPTVTVVVPALNEARNLQVVLPAIAAVQPPVHEVIVVDGNSVDGSVDTARRVLPSVKIVRQTRRGKGNAMACGFAAATGDVIVMFDADGSADPAEIPAFVAALVAGADFAKGSRFVRGGGSDDITLLRKTGNAGLNGVANVLFGTRHTDLCYGYNAFWRDLLPVLELPAVDAPAPVDGSMLWGDGFEIETVLNCRVAAAGLRVTEVPSHEKERLFGDTNLRTFADGSRVLRTLAAERRRAAQRRTERATLPAPEPALGPATNGFPIVSTANGATNGTAVGATNGIAVGATNGIAVGATNGAAAGSTNGAATNGVVNGSTNGVRTERPGAAGQPLPAPGRGTRSAEPEEQPVPAAAANRSFSPPVPAGWPAEGAARPVPQHAAAQREPLGARYALEEEAS